MGKSFEEELKDFNILTDESIVRMAREGSGYAYDILISKYKDLAKTIARKYYINGADNEDVVQEGMIGIFKAIRDYDLDGTVPFKGFAGLCIERQIQTAVSGANREKHKILNESLPLYVTNSTEDGEDETLPERNIAETISATKANEPEQAAVLRENLLELRALCRERLSELEKNVFNMLMEGKGYKEIAAELGKSPKSIDNAIQRIKKKIGHMIEINVY